MKNSDFISLPVKTYLSSAGFTENTLIEEAGSAGSGRRYFRIKQDNQSLIIQTNHEANEDYYNYIEFGKILRSAKVPVPQIFFSDQAAAQIVTEDFGTTSLFDCVIPVKDSARARARILYDLVINELVAMQMESASVFLSNPALGTRKFDYAALKWETDYFSENYLKKHCGIFEIPTILQEAFATLACNVDMQPKVLMHRDFQSQNIMVLSDASVGFIDFQGLRRGSQYYDLASLLWDPYVMLPTHLIEEFFKKWLGRFPGVAGFSDEEAWISFLAASLQRLMQALGAYCFLSKEKKIEKFAEYIESGKKQLKTALDLYKEYSRSANKIAANYLGDFLETK